MITSSAREKALGHIVRVLDVVEGLRALAPEGQKTFQTYPGSIATHITTRNEFDLLLNKLDSEGILKFKELDNGLSWGENQLYIGVPDWEKFDEYYKKIKAELEGKEYKGNISTIYPGTLDSLHQEIREKCSALYKSANYPEAVEKGFKIVKDRLRKLTTYEKGHEAFGKGKLYIIGASADNVDEDFQHAVQYLTMAIDMFKNEKGHTSDSKIEDPVRAFEYLSLSSLALNLLDNAKIKK